MGEIGFVKRMVRMIWQAGVVYPLHLRMLCEIRDDSFLVFSAWRS